MGGNAAGGVSSASGGVAPFTGGAPSGGGVASTNGGASASGGSPSSGGTGSTCAPVTATACTAPQVVINEVDVGAPVVVNEDDAGLKMLSISAVPSGGSRVAWMSNDANVHVTTLGCSDDVAGSFTLPANDYADIYADDTGGVVLLSRDAQGGGTLNCGNPTNLCGTPPSPAIPCYDMYLVRFDGTTEKWATKLTVSDAQLPPYSTGPMGPETYFIWWYAHHGRLASDGTNFAAYYGAATSITQMCTTGGNTAINIHQGDEMRVVDPTGNLLKGQNGFDWGCSHSGFEKIVWDGTANHYALICRSDAYPHVGLNVNASNLVDAISATDSSIGNIVLASTAGSYWTLVTNSGTLHLLEFTSAGGTTADLDMGSGDSPHLAKYGNHLFAAWVPASGTNMVGQVLDAGTGAPIGSTVPIAVPSNQFQDFRDYPDGSVAYAAPGSSATKIKIVRVLPCTG